MITIFEQYHELDPYEEEDWDDEGNYLIKKSFLGVDPQNGFRYYITFKNSYDLTEMIRNFDTFVSKTTALDMADLNDEDIRKLESGEYFITNGWAWNSKDCQKITLNEIRKKINVKL